MEFSHTLPSSTAFRLISKSKPGQIKEAMVSGLQDGKLTLSFSHATQTSREARVSGCQDGKVKRLTLPEPHHIKHPKTKAPPVGGASLYRGADDSGQRSGACRCKASGRGKPLPIGAASAKVFDDLLPGKPVAHPPGAVAIQDLPQPLLVDVAQGDVAFGIEAAGYHGAIGQNADMVAQAAAEASFALIG